MDTGFLLQYMLNNMDHLYNNENNLFFRLSRNV